MTSLEKRRFVTDLIRNIKQGLLDDVARVPEHGHELRQWIADRFQRSAGLQSQQPCRRYREYLNDLAAKNL